MSLVTHLQLSNRACSLGRFDFAWPTCKIKARWSRTYACWPSRFSTVWLALKVASFLRNTVGPSYSTFLSLFCLRLKNLGLWALDPPQSLFLCKGGRVCLGRFRCPGRSSKTHRTVGTRMSPLRQPFCLQLFGTRIQPSSLERRQRPWLKFTCGC